MQGPAYTNWDFAAVKNIRVTESKEFQFRGELFNFLNHANLRLPNSDISSPTFGEIHSDLGPRVIQVALKFLFCMFDWSSKAKKQVPFDFAEGRLSLRPG